MERVGGNNQWNLQLEEFNDCLFSCEIDDLRFTGCHYTWTNRQDASTCIFSKLDRVLVNERWIRSHTSSSAHFPPPGISDHSPAIVHVAPPPKPTPKPFKFFDFIADHPLFLSIVQGTWRRIIIGNPMYCVYEKLWLLQAEFRKLNKQEFSDISKRVSQTQFLLESLQTKLGVNPSDYVTQQEEKLLFKQFLTLSRAEECLARQKSWINWMKLGDQCTSFFFKYVNNNRNRSKLTSLVLSDSSITHDITIIKSTFVNFYSNLLGKPHDTQYLGSDRVNQLINRRLTNTQSLAMVQDVTDLEIRETMWELNPHKAPGPDGYNAGFFQKAWPIVGHETTSAIENFFRSGQLLGKANATVVALVPKIPNPSKVGDFRPISCCNTIYKCIARILAKILQNALPLLIDPVQSGFVKGRRIADNIYIFFLGK